MNWEQLVDWFMGLGEPYGVNPIIFGSIYVGAVPFFWLAVAWLLYNIRRKRSVAGPVLLACACAVSAYVYLIIVGENVPLWVYGLLMAIIGYALYTTWQKMKARMKEAAGAETDEEPSKQVTDENTV